MIIVEILTQMSIQYLAKNMRTIIDKQSLEKQANF